MKKQDKLKEFRRMTKSQLLFLLNEMRNSLRQLRFDLITGKIKNIREIRKTKKDIALILTLIKKT